MLNLKNLKAKDKAVFFSSIFFITAELIFLILIEIGMGSATNAICFASVVTAFLFCLFVSRNELDSLFVACALFFTVCADFCLVIMNPQPRILAMVFFNAVQLLYFARLIRIDKCQKTRTIHLLVRGIAIALGILLATLVLKENTDFLSIISIIYFANLAVNILYSFLSGRERLLFSFGLVFFALCDIFVGLSVLLADYLTVAEDSIIYKLTHTEINLVWLFYVPSQTLIALSSIKCKTK